MWIPLRAPVFKKNIFSSQFSFFFLFEKGILIVKFLDKLMLDLYYKIYFVTLMSLKVCFIHLSSFYIVSIVSVNIYPCPCLYIWSIIFWSWGNNMIWNIYVCACWFIMYLLNCLYFMLVTFDVLGRDQKIQWLI